MSAAHADAAYPEGPRVTFERQWAHWLARDVIAWPEEVPDGHTATLHASAQAAIAIEDGALTGADTSLDLTVDAAGLAPARIDEGWRHLAGFTALRLPPAAGRDTVADMLRGQVVLSITDPAGHLVAASGVQIPGVLDDLYADAAEEADLGVRWHGEVPTLRLWAPTAHDVQVHLFEASQPTQPAEPAADAHATLRLTRDDASGVWEVTGARDWTWHYFLYEVTVYAPATGRVERNLVTDPYSHSLSMDSVRSQIVDLTDPALQPPGWGEVAKPASDANPSIYELHVRDFSSADPSVPQEYVGTFKAFTLDDTHGVRHLRALAEAGLTHVHLLPTNDIATIPEDPADQVVPDMPDREHLRVHDPASPEPQAIQQATRDRDAFNWGYDPFHFAVPEGSYATDADGPERIVEFRELVQALNRLGLRVVIDVVYNHTYACGQHPRSVLDRVVPGYYHRLDEAGRVETSSCCPNTATEHRMMAKLMLDSVRDWARHYHVDGFRFDIMSHHTKANLLAVRQVLDALTVDRDGVDGAAVILYGEGWEFGEVAGDRRFAQASQRNLAGTGIATFNDRIRDAVRGGRIPAGLTDQGFATGLATAPNALEERGEADQRAQALAEQLWVQLGLAGNLAGLELAGPDGAVLRGDEIRYDETPAGYASSPRDSVAYVSCHDDQTLFDAIQMKAPAGLPVHERVRMQLLALSVVALSQGMAFFHAGSDLLRSKSLDANSFNSGDWFNRLDWTMADNNAGVGLPPEAENGDAWPVQREVLETLALPRSADIALSAAVFREWLEIRASSSLFHLGSAREVDEYLTFHATGARAEPGRIVIELSGDGRAEDVAGVLVVFNARPLAVTVAESSIPVDEWRLHPVQRRSVDARVGEAAYIEATHEFTVPARTTAVFVRSPM